MIKNINFIRGFMPSAGIVLLLLLPSCQSGQKKDAYGEEIAAWRKSRIERLKSENGWLNLAGLFWLKEGKNTFGSDSSNDLVFPENAPAFAGVITKKDTLITLTIGKGVEIRSDGEIHSREELRSDATGKPTQLKMGTLSFFVIRRDTMFGIRLRDLESPMLNRLDSIPCFPADIHYRIRARFVPFDSVRTIEIQTVINTLEKYRVPGKIEFWVEGNKCTLLPFDEGNQFFLLFADATSARETYGSGRFLYADKPDTEGNVILDFNKAYNPPCAFTPFATCPLPPKENLLNVAIRAGEKDVHIYVH
ncbi:MAG: DUF1684 domain-containing protein [Bacteroidales bacterium]